jgi:proline racemase
VTGLLYALLSADHADHPGNVDGRAAVIPQVTGMAYRTGEHVFWVDPHDPLVPGFVLR